jgi:UDP-3-O-[3-hydroxymyristoyl] glucosamine N-acyltransferase
LIREEIETSYKIKMKEVLEELKILKGKGDKKVVYSHRKFVEPMLEYIVKDFEKSRISFDDSTIGNETVIWSGSVIRERSKIGSHCIFHTNVSIGADGFGYRPSSDGRGLVKIKHIGNVVIGNGVEVGANSCIDRGKFSSTILGDGCKIDNLVQIGHNSVLGKCCIMAGNSGLAGSVTLGDGVIIGGSASIKDHVTIHSGAKVGAGSGVISDVAAGKTVLGYPACDSREKMKQWVALRKLARN